MIHHHLPGVVESQRHSASCLVKGLSNTHVNPLQLGFFHPAHVLRSLAVILPVALVAARCLPAPSLALPAVASCAALLQLRGFSAASIPHAPRSHAPARVLPRPP